MRKCYNVNSVAGMYPDGTLFNGLIHSSCHMDLYGVL